MAKGKRKGSPITEAPEKVHLRHYVCEACKHHHGAFTKIGKAHRKYARKEA